MSGLSETISFVEPRPPEELGGDITRTCIRLLDGRDRKFSKVLSDGRIFENVSTALTAYLEKLENAHPDEVLRTVRVTVNDYLEQLGIGLMSCRVEPLNRDSDPMRLSDEEKSPTVGVIPEISQNRLPPQVVHFKVEQGGEELTALTENFCMRGYIPNEHPSDYECRLQPRRRGDTVLVPQKSSIGVRVKLFDDEKLRSSLFQHNVFPITHDASRTMNMPDTFEPGQVYFCRYLTREAVREALGL